jgi:hypothetical protein
MSDDRIASYERVLRMVRANFSSEIPAESAIRKQIEVLVGIEDELHISDVEPIFEEICAQLNIRMDLGVLVEAPGHLPWLAEQDPKWEWWKAYRQSLANEGRSPVVIETLNEALDTILDQLGNPGEQKAWSRRGLVIGDVQSGKTSTYIGLIDKAIDVGYNVVILLTGNTEALRAQTQERVDSGVVGRDSSRNQVGEKIASHLIGVGKILDSTAKLDSMTTQVSDFRKSSREAVNTIPGSGKVVVFVTKKNKTVLTQIRRWFEQRMPPDTKSPLPLLLIDDESDYASINTKADDDDPTAINRAIRDLLALSSRNSYVGFTATPFANIFIDDEIEEDLFPRDFIYGLNSPSNYVGAKSIFGGDSDSDPIRANSDAEIFFPVPHKKDLEVAQLPDSMIEAIRAYLLTNAIRDLRGQRGKPTAMLINVSRFVLVQGQVTELVQECIAGYKNAIQLHSEAYAGGTGQPLLQEIHETFETEFTPCEFGWLEVLNSLESSNSPVKAVVINSKANRDDELPLRYVAVGGDILSRGLTLEGLSTSYFFRFTRASDTLMQMARWFGYREGYSDLCRIWISDDMSVAYGDVSDALEELRDELGEMRRQQLTPRQYGLSVKYHKESLAITARNKMRSAVRGEKAISLRGSMHESRVLPSDPQALQANLAAAERLLRQLEETHGAPEALPGRSHLLWREVDKLSVASFFEEFTVFPSWSAGVFTDKAIARFVKFAEAADLQSWDVALMGGRGGTMPELAGLLGNHGLPERGMDGSQKNGWRVSGSKSRVAGPGDVSLSLDPARKKEIDAAYKPKEGKTSVPDPTYIKDLSRPLLLLYPLRAKPKKDAQEVPPTSIPLVAVCLAIPGQRIDDKDKAVYTINRVAQRLWFPELMDQEDEEPDDIS